LSSLIVELENVSKVYRVGRDIEVQALNNVNLSIRRGEILVIMGPSGSGKSTLLNIMGTLDRPTSGRVLLDETDVTDLPERDLYDIRLRKIGFVFQFYNLISTLTALENVMLPIVLLGALSEDDAREKAEELLRIVGLGDKLNARPTQLSGGQQQRVAIARALANDPPLVLMDEPTGNIDIVSEAVILKLLKTLNRYLGTTFVIVTHNPEVALIGDRIVYIRGGKLFEEKTIPKIDLKDVLDEAEIVRLQLEFLKREVLRLRRSRGRGVISREEYEELASRIRQRLERMRRVLREG